MSERTKKTFGVLQNQAQICSINNNANECIDVKGLDPSTELEDSARVLLFKFNSINSGTIWALLMCYKI